MVTVKIGDGLGNQIYNFVCGYAVAESLSQPLCLDISDAENNPIRSYMLDCFDIGSIPTVYYSNKTVFHKIYKRLKRDMNNHVVFERGYSSFGENKAIFDLNKTRNIYLHGYWQSIEYFRMYEDKLRAMLVPAYDMAAGVRKLIDEFKSSETCAVHLRGGDIAMPEAHYFKDAMEKMSAVNPGVKYIIFTNDREKALTRLADIRAEYSFIEDYSKEYGDFTDVDSFFLISACHHQIVSESTYSIWAAILNSNRDKTVIAPRCEASHERCPSEWIFC